MSVVKPVELIVGPARNQTVIGRACLLDSSTVTRHGKASDHVELHLVVEKGSSGGLYVEAWRDQARRLTQVARQGKILKLTNLMIRNMGDGNVHLTMYTGW